MPESSIGGVGDQVREAVDILEDANLTDTTEAWQDAAQLVKSTEEFASNTIGIMAKLATRFESKIVPQANATLQAGEEAHAKMTQAAVGSGRKSAQTMTSASGMLEGAAAEEIEQASAFAIEAREVALIATALKERLDELRRLSSAGSWVAELKATNRPMAIEAGKAFIEEIGG